MHWMKTLNKYPWPLYLIGGLLIGLFVGYQVLPRVMPRKAALVTAAEATSQLKAQQQIEEKLAAALVFIEGVEDAQVQLSVALAGTKRAYAEASVTLTLTGAALSTEQLAGIAEQVATGVEGLKPGRIAIADASGRSLNREAVIAQERQQFWTDIAINVARVLGILAAMITMRYVIQAIGRGVLGEDGKC